MDKRKDLFAEHKTLFGTPAPANISTDKLEEKINAKKAEDAQIKPGAEGAANSSPEPPAAAQSPGTEGGQSTDTSITDDFLANEKELILSLRERNISGEEYAMILSVVKSLMKEEIELILVVRESDNPLSIIAALAKIKGTDDESLKHLEKLSSGEYSFVKTTDLDAMKLKLSTLEGANNDALNIDINTGGAEEENISAEEALHNKRVAKYGPDYVVASGGGGISIFSALTWKQLSPKDKALWKREVKTPEEVQHLVKD